MPLTFQNSKKIYKALQKELPGRSDVKIGDVVGLVNSTVSKLKRGYGLGQKAAEWLVDQDPKYQPLLDEANRLLDKRRDQGYEKRWRNKHPKKKRPKKEPEPEPEMSTYVKLLMGKLP